MNQEQTNYLLSSFLQYSVCSNEDCPMWLSTFETNDYSRCPICNEPALLPSALKPTIKDSKSQNIFERYFSNEIVNLFRKGNLLKSADNIGNTPLSTNKSIQNWVGIDNLYLKEEYSNPSGSFKDRGTWTALALLRERLTSINSNQDSAFVLGTVSTGNMAISTAFMVNQLDSLTQAKLNSFIVVNANTSEKKIKAIEKASGKIGTTIFVVEGDYAQFHEQVYIACRQLRNKGVAIYAQLTDDLFRIIGYGTLFAEIIEQLKTLQKEPDFIMLPIASGALFRVAIWALESLQKQGYIQKIPRVILVQEKGADPIIQAFQQKLGRVQPIKMQGDLLADGIDVSYSRSGTIALRILQDNYHRCISVSTKEIREAYEELSQQGFHVEEASAAAVAGAKKLHNEGELSKTAQVICVLTGGNIFSRHLGDVVGESQKVFCTLNELGERLTLVFEANNEMLSSQAGYFC